VISWIILLGAEQNESRTIGLVFTHQHKTIHEITLSWANKFLHFECFADRLAGKEPIKIGHHRKAAKSRRTPKLTAILLTANCSLIMSTIQEDFDRIALVSPDGSLQNNHYHNFLLRQLPNDCRAALEIGCGKGEFSRRLAERSQKVLALDLSPEMIRIARERSVDLPNIDFQLADVMSYDLPHEGFDCIATIATLHHLALREIFMKMKAALKPGGVLLVLDLFESIKLHGQPARDSERDGPSLDASNTTATNHNQPTSLREGLIDTLLNALAVPVSVTLRLIHHGRLLPNRTARAAWAAHERHDIYPTMKEVHALCAEILPGAKIKKHLLWRYSIIWKK
jgi:SAM-dependent methyltransferase